MYVLHQYLILLSTVVLIMSPYPNVKHCCFHQVVWQRKGEQFPLTTSTFSFIADGRFVVENEYKEEWNLRILKATKNDSGIYQCRVSTRAMLLVREVHLTVQGIYLCPIRTICLCVTSYYLAPACR